MNKAVLFIRVSTEQQTTDSQREALTHYAMADGYALDNIIYIEKKESGFKLDEAEREGIAELYQAMEDSEVSDVYIWELSRLSRRPKDLYSIREKFLERKVQLHCQEPAFCLLNKERDGYDSNANILFSLFGAMAEQEVIEKKARFARGKKRLAEQGRYNGGAIPYGYKVDASRDNLIVIDEEDEAPIVREIYNMYEHGKSQPAIAKELFERGVKGRAARKTKAFTISLVHQILTNELLTGKKHLNKGSSYERQYPQIISEEQFQRCRKIAEANNTVLPKARRVYYAQGLIKCTECGRNFISTGCKGYYHCKDAYNCNKKYEGYDGQPMCSNKIIISNNIMDSLLWELTKDYEAIYIMSEASRKLSECQEQKDILQKKIDAIPSLLAAVEEKKDFLLDALAEGMKKEKFNVKKQKLSEEERKIRASEVSYREEMGRYEMLISDIKKSMSLNLDIQSQEGIDNFIDYTETVRCRVRSITDDAERSRLIHKHIKKVTVEATTVPYKFAKYPEETTAFAKLITVYPYLGKERIFVFVPYNGKGGVMLEKHKKEERYVIPGINKEVVIPIYTKFHMEYLPRFYDKGKQHRREVVRAQREALKSSAIDELRKDGYISMNEMREISKLGYSTLYHAIKAGQLNGKNLFHTWYAKADDFKYYLEKYSPKPRPYRQTQKVVKLSPEEKLLNAIMGAQINDTGEEI